jgi:hypothetical protein
MALTKVPSNLDATIATTQSQADNSTNIATTAYVDLAISNLSDSAPAALNTLNEIAAALGDDANYASTTTAAIAGKLPLAGGTMTGNLTVNAIVDADNYTINGGQGTDGQVLTSTGSGVAWEDAPAGGPTFKTFGTSSIMIGDDATGTINAANYNTGLGVDVFDALTTGDENTVIGFEAGNALTVHNQNTLIGYQAGKLLGGSSESWEAQRNTFIGYAAGRDVDEGQGAIAIGYYSMMSSLGTTTNDIAIGYQAMQYRQSNTGDSIAIGANAHRGDINQGYQNANRNVAIGTEALSVIETGGQQNTAIGWYAGQNATTGPYNTLIGSEAGQAVSTGQKNTLIGFRAGELITTGNYNVVLGGYDGNEGSLDIRTASNRVVISDGAGNIRMYIDNSGKVGIGTTSPTQGLTVSDDIIGDDANMRRITIKSQTHGVNSGFRFDSESANGTARAGGYYFQPGDTDADTYLGLTATDAAYQMVITREGNVGIGTSPASKLHVESGTAHNKLSITSTASGGTGYDAVIDLLGSASNSECAINMGINGDADREQIKTYQSDMAFRTNNTSRMTLKSNGDLLLNADTIFKTIPVSSPHSDFGYNVWGNYYVGARATSGRIMVGSVNTAAAYVYLAYIHWSFGGSNSDAIYVEVLLGAGKLDWQLTSANTSTPTIQVKDTYNYGTQIVGQVQMVTVY